MSPFVATLWSRNQSGLLPKFDSTVWRRLSLDMGMETIVTVSLQTCDTPLCTSASSALCCPGATSVILETVSVHKQADGTQKLLCGGVQAEQN